MKYCRTMTGGRSTLGELDTNELALHAVIADVTRSARNVRQGMTCDADNAELQLVYRLR